MPKAAELETTTTLSRGTLPLEIRNGVARFEGGQELALRQVEVRSNTAIEVVDELSGKKSRTVEVVWTTGASVLRYSWRDGEYYEESLEVSDKAIRLDRMRNGASVLNSHWGYDLDSVLATVEDVRIEGGKGIAKIRFSNRSSVDDIWQDVQDGIIRHISVGYRVHAWNEVRKEGEMTRKVATDWEPHEISFVAIPADSGCSVREAENIPAHTNRTESNVSQATDTNTPASAGTESTAARSEQTAAAPANNDNQGRSASETAAILRYAESLNMSLRDANKLVASGDSLEEIIRKQVDEVANDSRSTDVNVNRTSAAVTSGRSSEREMDLRTEMRTAELLESCSIRSDFNVSDEAREFAGEGLRGAAISFLRSINISVNERMSDEAIIGEALNRSAGGGFTTADFLSIVTKPAEAALDQGWKNSIPETTYREWTGEVPLKDFNARETFSASLFSGIGRVSEDGELPLAEMGGTNYTLKLETHGIEIALTRPAIVNDDIGLWVSGMNDLGISWGLYNEARAIDTLENGFVISEGTKKKIFSEAAGNVIEISDLDDDGLETLILALRSQRQNSKLGGLLVPTAPKFLMVSPDMERKANALVDPRSSNELGAPRPYAGKLQVIVIDSFAPRTVYVTGGSAMKNMIKRTFKQGQNGPKLERMAMTSSQRVVYHSYEDAKFQGASHLGAVKAKFAAAPAA